MIDVSSPSPLVGGASVTPGKVFLSCIRAQTEQTSKWLSSMTLLLFWSPGFCLEFLCQLPSVVECGLEVLSWKKKALSSSSCFWLGCLSQEKKPQLGWELVQIMRYCYTSTDPLFWERLWWHLNFRLEKPLSILSHSVGTWRIRILSNSDSGLAYDASRGSWDSIRGIYVVYVMLWIGNV